MAASSESLHLQPPIPPTPKPNHPNPIPIPIPLCTGLAALNNEADLLSEILLWLPAKYLIRFKSVCKKWRSLISSDYFCHQHTLRHPKLQSSFLLRHSAPWLGFDYFYWNRTSTDGGNAMIPFTLSVSRHYKILQACNGLLLLRGLDFDSDRCTHLVYNPTTRKSAKIIPTYNDKDNYVAAIGLAFDPSISPYYKIVCIMRFFAPRAYEVVVYDSETHLWELSLGPFSHPSRFCFRKQLYWNNAIFWCCARVDAYYRFDIAKNEMSCGELDNSREELVDFTAPPFDYSTKYDGKVYSVESFQFGETMALV